MRDVVRRVLPSTLSVLSALIICFIATALTRGGLGIAFNAYVSMLWGAIGDWPKLFDGGDAGTILRPLGESSTKAALLLFTGLSVAVAFRVGLFNIGAQGQLMVGALASAVVGANLELPAPLHLTLCLAAAALGGGLYALGPAWLKLRRGVHEVISTITPSGWPWPINAIAMPSKPYVEPSVAGYFCSVPSTSTAPARPAKAPERSIAWSIALPVSMPALRAASRLKPTARHS